MSFHWVPRIFSALLLMASVVAHAQDPAAVDLAVPTIPSAKGSTAFCLYELPKDGSKRRWINLGIVQYLEANRDELRIYYGGGNLGSGYETRLPLGNEAQADEMLAKIRQAAAACR